MIRLLSASLLVTLFLGSCDSGKDSADSSSTVSDSLTLVIKGLEDKLYGDESLRFDEGSALLLMNAYVDYQSAYPEDTLSADYLFKAAEIAMQLGDYRKSLLYFSEVHEKYPSYRNRPLALFYQGNIYDDRVNNDEKAGEIYNQFLELYPEHPFANDVKALLGHLGKSDEELLKEFEAKNRGI